jgi:hypothetical protein
MGAGKHSFSLISPLSFNDDTLSDGFSIRKIPPFNPRRGSRHNRQISRGVVANMLSTPNTKIDTIKTINAHALTSVFP